MTDKVCPLVLRWNKNVLEILAFKHPTERKQLVKGTIDAGEHPAQAAVRELAEESGLICLDTPKFVGKTNTLIDLNNWYFYVCKVINDIPDQWDFETLDDGGHTFSFFWQDLSLELNDEWHPLYHDVFAFARPVICEHFAKLKHS